MKKNILIVGAGAVGTVVAHKCAQNGDRFGAVCLSSKSLRKCEAVLRSIERRGYPRARACRLVAREVDARDTRALIQLIVETQADIVINVCTAFVNMSVIEACLATGAAYLDTAVHEDPAVLNAPYPWYANFEWKRREDFARRGLTAILGVGFDPGVVNAYCAYAQRYELDTVTSIDIMDVNDGSHGRFFSTNFDPEINLREVIEDAGCLEDGEWRTYPHHSRTTTFDFPEVGRKKLYLMGHDEVHSLSVNVPDVKTVRFWMGFDDHYLNCLNVFEQVGLLNHREVTTASGQAVVPLHVLKACLPNPASLAATYTGKTCIGTLVSGKRDGEDREVFLYNVCDHEAAYADVGSQAIAFTAGVPPVAAALLVASGPWDCETMANVEELDPVPFLKLLKELGLPTILRRPTTAGFDEELVLFDDAVPPSDAPSRRPGIDAPGSLSPRKTSAHP